MCVFGLTHEPLDPAKQGLQACSAARLGERVPKASICGVPTVPFVGGRAARLKLAISPLVAIASARVLKKTYKKASLKLAGPF